MKSFNYNLALFGANALYALNFSLFVSLLESMALTIGSIYLLQCVVLFFLLLLLRLLGWGSRGGVAPRDIAIIIFTSILSSLGWNYTMLWGMSLTSPIDAATIASVGPSLTLIFAHALHRRSLTGMRVVGLVLSLLGVTILVVSRAAVAVSRVEIKGNVILLFAVVVAAINTLLFKPQLERYGVVRVAQIYSMAALAVTLPLFWGSLSSLASLSLNLGSTVELILLLLIGSSLPLMLLFEGTEYLTPLHTSLYRYLQPLIAAGVVVARHQVQLTAANYVALLVIVVGGILVAQGVDRAV